MEIHTSIGNNDILQFKKTAFLCSRQIPANVVLKCYDWAIKQREKGNCVISGFHSQIEKDVLHYLLKGKQPVIIALARGFKQKTEPEFIKPIEQGRLLIVSPFPKEIKRVTTKTALIRNKFMLDLADEVVIGYMKKGGNLINLISECNKSINFITNNHSNKFRNNIIYKTE